MSSRPFVLSALISLICAQSSFAADKPADASASTPASTPANAAPASVQATTPSPAQTSAPASGTDAPAEEGPTIIDLVKTNDYRAAWAFIFKGEYSPSRWVETLDATATPLTEVTNNGKTYLVGIMCNISNPKGNKFVVSFTADKKKGWGVELTVPAGIGRDAVLHPKKYATIRYFNNPDIAMKKLLMDYLANKEPAWK